LRSTQASKQRFFACDRGGRALRPLLPNMFSILIRFAPGGMNEAGGVCRYLLEDVGKRFIVGSI
ncbi:MAG: hypothetical protein AAGE92_05640, partial [Cyanobacteria bacterium P01_G01_bin.4]